MKRFVKIGLVIVPLVLLLVMFLWYTIRVPNKNEPDKLANIPKSAVWKGDVDEGFWFDVVKIDTKRKVYRIRIYNDYKGELVLDADFIKSSNCSVDYPVNQNILDHVSYFEINKIVMNNNCSFDFIKPAYGGVFKD